MRFGLPLSIKSISFRLVACEQPTQRAMQRLFVTDFFTSARHSPLTSSRSDHLFAIFNRSETGTATGRLAIVSAAQRTLLGDYIAPYFQDEAVVFAPLPEAAHSLELRCDPKLLRATAISDGIELKRLQITHSDALTHLSPLLDVMTPYSRPPQQSILPFLGSRGIDQPRGDLLPRLAARVVLNDGSRDYTVNIMIEALGAQMALTRPAHRADERLDMRPETHLERRIMRSYPGRPLTMMMPSPARPLRALMPSPRAEGVDQPAAQPRRVEAELSGRRVAREPAPERRGLLNRIAYRVVASVRSIFQRVKLIFQTLRSRA